MVLTFNKTVEIKNNKLSCLYYTYIVVVFLSSALWCFVGHTLEEQSIITSSTSEVAMHVQLSVPSIATTTGNSTMQVALCDAAQASDSNRTCSGTVMSCAGLSATCLADRDANVQESSKEAFIATSFSLVHSDPSSQYHHTGILTTASEQSVLLRYLVLYPDRSGIDIFWRGVFRLQEMASTADKSSIRDDNALTVILDSSDSVWSRIDSGSAQEAGGIRLTLPELLELSGVISSSNSTTWLETWVSGLDLDMHVSCYDEPTSDDEESRDIWEGPTCYIQVLRNNLHTSAFPAGRKFNTWRWLADNRSGTVENHLSWDLNGVRIRADISRSSWEVSAGRVLLHIVVLTMLIWIGKWVLYYIIRNCLGKLSTVYRHALSEPFSILGEVASATVESVVQGLCYREMDGDNLLDGEGNVPLKSIETQIQQLVRSMQPLWTDEEVAAFTALAVHSLLAKDPQNEELRRCWRCFRKLCCWKFWFGLCCPRRRPDLRTTQSIPMDRFVAASTQQSVSRIEVLGNLFRKDKGSCSFLEKVFTPKEVQDKQWIVTDEADELSQSTEVVKGKQSVAEDTDPTSSKGSKGRSKMSVLASALGDEEQGPAKTPENSKSVKNVRIEAGLEAPAEVVASPSAQAVVTSPSGRAGRQSHLSASLMAGPVQMMNRLKQPAASVQMSTRSFAAQLADMDRSILQMLTQVEDKHAATLGSWRSKATMLAERIDTMETSLRTLEEHLIDGDTEQSHTSINTPSSAVVTPSPQIGADRPRMTTTNISVRSTRGTPGLDIESASQLENLRLDTDALEKRLINVEDILNLQQMAVAASGAKKSN